jgi:hypothetical protein
VAAIVRKYCILALLGWLAAPAIGAQTAPPTAIISGTVTDSLHYRPLVGATITVEGTMIIGATDSLGHFRLADVPAGTQQIAVYHPLLDSLGVSIYTPPTAIPPGVETSLQFSVPSPATLMTRFCPGDTSVRALVVGQVLDADSDTPIAKASVSSWGVATLDAPRQLIIRNGPVSRRVTTDDGGRFHYCLPHGIDFAIAASLGNSTTGQIPLDIANGVALPVMRVARVDSVKPSNRGHLSGHVVDGAGQPVEGASVSIVAAHGNAKTGSDGAFTLSSEPAGTQMLDVRHVGFAELTTPVTVSIASPANVTVTLQPKVPTLARVDINAAALAAAYHRTGFEVRQKHGWGQFMTSDQIRPRDAGSATSLLAGIPGVRLVYTSKGPRVVSSRGVGRSCTAFVVDGQPVYRGVASDDEGLPQASDIIGIEVYQANEPILDSPPTRCLTVLVWTRAELGS